MISKLKN